MYAAIYHTSIHRPIGMYLVTQFGKINSLQSKLVKSIWKHCVE